MKPDEPSTVSEVLWQDEGLVPQWARTWAWSKLQSAREELGNVVNDIMDDFGAGTACGAKKTAEPCESDEEDDEPSIRVDDLVAPTPLRAEFERVRAHPLLALPGGSSSPGAQCCASPRHPPFAHAGGDVAAATAAAAYRRARRRIRAHFLRGRCRCRRTSRPHRCRTRQEELSWGRRPFA